MVNSDQMRELLRQLKSSFDFVLVDTPPVMAFSDSITLSRLVEGTFLVVRVGDASRGNEAQAKIALEKAGANMLGVVVNGVASCYIDSFQFHAHYYQRPALPETSETALEIEEDLEEGDTS